MINHLFYEFFQIYMLQESISFYHCTNDRTSAFYVKCISIKSLNGINNLQNSLDQCFMTLITSAKNI